MAFDITNFTQVLRTIQIGVIPADIIAILLVIVLAIIITKGQKQKAIMALAPLSTLVIAMGFNINLIFVILAMALFGIYSFINVEFEKDISNS